MVFVALLAGGSLAGIIGALLALPFASAMLMLLDELRVQLLGQSQDPGDDEVRRADDATEREYGERTSGMSAREAAGVAAEIVEENQASPPATPTLAET